MSRLTDEELAEAFEYAHGSLRLTAALSELKERRAADLTWDEADCLGSLGERYREVRTGLFPWEERALAALTRLLNARGAK